MRVEERYNNELLLVHLDCSLKGYVEELKEKRINKIKGRKDKRKKKRRKTKKKSGRKEQKKAKQKYFKKDNFPLHTILSGTENEATKQEEKIDLRDISFG